MRKVLRYEDNSAYWDRRWMEAGHDEDQFLSLDIYPIKYAEMVMRDKQSKAVELGAGLGRVLKHYHYQGFNIEGIERSRVAVERLKSQDPSLRIEQGDVTDLPHADGAFDVVMAFGLYHNLEEDIERALSETTRCLRPGGLFCVSMRPDNFEMKFNEWYWRRRRKTPAGSQPKFHKWLVTPSEFRDALLRHELQTDTILRARNVSLLYRIPWLRTAAAGEAERRAQGYRLNAVGRVLDRLLVTLFPSQFCNVIIFIGRKGTV